MAKGRRKPSETAQDSPKSPQAVVLRNRVVERRRMLGADLVQNPRNWRQHPKEQADALRGVLAEIGQAGELLAYHSERNGGKLTLVDGHLRASEFAGQEWDVAITDLSDDEADKLLLVHDPITAMATASKKAMEALMRDVQIRNEAVAGLIDGLAEANGIIEQDAARLKDVAVPLEPPLMTWVFIGLQTVRFPEIAAQIESIAAVPDVVMEMASNEKYLGQTR